MIRKKYYCKICDKYISNRNRHNKTKLHTQFSRSIVNRYYFNNIFMNEIDNTINKRIYDYKKKFRKFKFWCIIQNGYFCEKIIMILLDGPNIKIQNDIISRRKCNQKDLVNIKIIFITDSKYATYNHFFQLSKPMIERKFCLMIDRNPNLKKVLNHMPDPYKKHIIIKHWGLQYKCHDGMIRNYYPINWMDLEPNI